MYPYQASKNTISKLNPGKANSYGVLCKSFATFPGMFPYCFFLCYAPHKEMIFYGAPHVSLDILIGHFGSGCDHVYRNSTLQQDQLCRTAEQLLLGSHDVYQMSCDLLQPGSPASLASMSVSNGRASVSLPVRLY